MPDFYRHAIAVIVAALAYGGTLYLVGRASGALLPFSTLSLEQVIGQIKRELHELENTPGPTLGLLLDEVTVVLHVQREDARLSDATLTVPVFDESKLTASSSTTRADGSKVTVVLVPPEGTQTLSTPPGPRIEFSDILVATRESLQKSMQSEPRLDAKSIVVELSFVLTAANSSSSAVKAKVISVDGSTAGKDTSSNTITLKYSNPRYLAKSRAPATVTPP